MRRLCLSIGSGLRKSGILKCTMAIWVLLLVSSPVLGAAAIAAQAIASAVEDKLSQNKIVAAHRIAVISQSGIVTLTGALDTLRARDYAIGLAQTVKGVRAVISKISVRTVPRTDDVLRQLVQQALRADPALNKSEINVHVRDGIVSLSGTVSSWQEKQLASQVVKGVQGVQAVRNPIEVQVRGGRPDKEIAAEIRRYLELDYWLDASLITVEVRNGRVTLDGRVASGQQKEHAASVAWIGGVSGMDNSALAVDHTIRDEMQRSINSMAQSDEAIRQAVEAALMYDSRTMSQGIRVSVDEGTVVLAGTAAGQQARQAAEEDALNTVGVQMVKNQLEIN